MKKIFLLIFTVATFFSSYSQSFTLSNRNPMAAGSPTADNLESTVIITNTTASPITFTWVKIGQQLQSGWSYSFCDAMNCFDPVPDSNNFTLKAGKSASFQFKVNPNGKSGLGKFTIGVSTSGNNGPFDTVNFNVNAWSTGVSSNLSKLPELSIYPNPAQNELNINYDSKYTYQVEILNIIGNRMKVFTNMEG
ncbi:MAG: hypothetical protein HYZ42_01435, partial [Bacteroidetes bacterium]|nr:hypothetical protein [Bacteroidota bacterium]